MQPDPTTARSDPGWVRLSEVLDALNLDAIQAWATGTIPLGTLIDAAVIRRYLAERFGEVPAPEGADTKETTP
jgi:hypothetical protein